MQCVINVALVGLALLGSVGAAVADEPMRIKIASNYVRADGCHDTTQSFTTQIPNADRLDRSYHGVLDGIEVVETAANNGHAFRNFAFTSDGKAVTYQLYAKGAGHWVDPPRVIGLQVGGGACVGAAGASEGIEIYARYRPDR
jgi:hypothetical protein